MNAKLNQLLSQLTEALETIPKFYILEIAITHADWLIISFLRKKEESVIALSPTEWAIQPNFSSLVQLCKERILMSPPSPKSLETH